MYKFMVKSMKKIRPRNVLNDTVVLVAVISACIVICTALSQIDDDNNPFAVPVFILGIAIISTVSSGYICGILASVISVFCVNYMFTYPFWELNLTLTGYPLTFAVMLIVSIIISTLTTQVKKQQKVMYEAEMENMRANLLRAVSHDIRTPLASIVGSTSVLIEDKGLSDETKLELVKEINKDARWLSRLTENILSVTKFKTDGVKLRLVEEVAEEIISSAVVKFRRTSNIPITVKRPDDILLVPMEGTLIEQVLINLLENVVHHSPKATNIELSVRAEDKKAVFSVKDNGDGIDEKVLPHMFDGKLLIKTDTNKEGKRNMGIGLSVCNSIVKAHKGEMLAENNEDGGATVSFWIPMSEEKYEY